MCGDKIKNLAINAPLRKTKFTTLLTTKQRSEVVLIKFWSLMLTYYSVCRYDIIKNFMKNTVSHNRAVLKRLFLEVWKSTIPTFSVILHDPLLDRCLTCVGIRWFFGVFHKTCEYSSLSLLLTAEDVSREMRLRLAPKIRYWWRRYVRNLVNGHWLVDVHI